MLKGGWVVVVVEGLKSVVQLGRGKEEGGKSTL